MIQLTDDLWMDADENCYVMGKINKRRENMTEAGRKAREFIRPRYYPTAHTGPKIFQQSGLRQ